MRQAVGCLSLHGVIWIGAIGQEANGQAAERLESRVSSLKSQVSTAGDYNALTVDDKLQGGWLPGRANGKVVQSLERAYF